MRLAQERPRPELYTLHAQGTFLVRPSLSLAGAMVLSVVVDGAVKHMALDGNQLDTRSLEVRTLNTLKPTAAGRRFAGVGVPRIALLR